jgi:hypothetical protein
MVSPRRFASCCLSLIFACALPAGADIWVGKFGSAGAPDIVSVFPDGAQGNMAPSRLLGGPSSELVTATDITYVPSESAFYITDFIGQAIRVFAASAQGDAAPLRNVTSPHLGQPRTVVVLPAQNEILAISSNCCVGTYDRMANGDVFAQRFLNGALTQLTNPVGLAYRALGDEIYVGDYSASFTGEILVFPRTATGNVPPTRVISGPNTQLGTRVSGVVFHPTLPEMYALVATTVGVTSTCSIVTFDPSAAGDALPLRIIAGPNTGMINSGRFAYDPRTDEFLVHAYSTGSGTPALLAFPRAAQGDVSPSRVLSGPSTGMGGSYAVLAVDFDPIFKDGFEVGFEVGP